MKAWIFALIIVPSAAAGQQRVVALQSPIILEIRSTDSARVSNVAINIEARLFGSLGVLRPADGQVQCGPTGCIATTPAVLELTLSPGDGHLTVPADSPELEVTVRTPESSERRIIAHGHMMSFARAPGGYLEFRAPRMVTRF